MGPLQTERPMEVERLTPYLRRRVMRLPVEARVVLHREILQSLEQPERVPDCPRSNRSPALSSAR